MPDTSHEPHEHEQDQAKPRQAPLPAPPAATAAPPSEEAHVEDQRRAVVWAVGMYGGMLLVALIVRAVYQGEWFYVGDLGVPPLEPMLVAVGASLAVLLLSPLMERWQWVQRIARTVRQAFGRLSNRRAAVLGISSGTGEEVLFRGALQMTLGPVVATVLFAIMHGFGWWGLFALIMGAGLAALYAWSGNLWPCVVAHVLINTVNLARISRQPEPADESGAIPL